MSKKWMKETSGHEETKLGRKAAILGLLAASLLSGAAAGQNTDIFEQENTDVYGNNNGTNHNTYTGDANDNEIVIKEGAKVLKVRGGYTTNKGTADRNKVIVEGGEMTEVTGGESYGGTPLAARYNTVEIKGGKITGAVNGGKSLVTGAVVQNNEVTVSDGEINGEINGGWASNGSSEHNQVNISGGKMSSIAGGSAFSDASYNEVHVENGEGTHVIGGKNSSGVATENTVTIDNGTFTGSVQGVQASSLMYTGQPWTWVNATDNRVTINGGTFSSFVTGASVVRGFATGNRVIINGGSIINHGMGGAYTGIVGGSVNQTETTADLPSDVAQNIVSISGADTKIDVTYTSGKGAIIGGKVANVVGASENTVSINGVNGDGYVKADWIYGAYAAGDVSGNHVTIGDSVVSGKIFGAESKLESAEENSVSISSNSRITGDIYGATAFDDALNNHVTIGDSIVAGKIFGAQSQAKSAKDNSVVVSGSNQITGDIFGAKGVEEVSGNSVSVAGDGHITGSIYGTYGAYGEATGNSVELSGDTGLLKVDGNVYVGLTLNQQYTDKDSHVSGNEASFSGETEIGGSIYGGFSYLGDVYKNKLTFEGKTEVGGNVMSGYSAYANVKENEISIKGQFAGDGALYSGYAYTKDAEDNKLTIDGDFTGKGSIISGFSVLGDANRNEVSVKGDFETTGGVYGSYAYNGGSANENSVHLEGTNGKMKIGANLIGARSDKGNANSNTVEVDRALELSATLYGGYAPQGDAKSNSVLLKGDMQLKNSLIAGSAGGEASGNYISLDGNNQIATNLIGGYSTNGNTNNNTVMVNHALELGAALFGGQSLAGDAKNNIVHLKGDMQLADSLIAGAADGEVSSNQVILDGDNHIDGSLMGGRSENGNASDNIVMVDHALELGAALFGGRALAGDANNNKVFLRGDTHLADGLIGGSADGEAGENYVSLDGDNHIDGSLMGGRSENGDANNNTLLVRNSLELGAALCGGYASRGEAKKNNVLLKGDMHIIGDLVGGYADGEAGDNLVSLEGDIRIDGYLRGGFSIQGLSSNNTLEIRSENIRVGGLSDFQNLKFYFPESVQNGDVMIKVANETADEVDITGSQIKLFYTYGSGGTPVPLNPGERVILIDTRGGLTGDPLTDDNRKISVRCGVSLDYDDDRFELSYDDDDDKKQLIVSIPGGDPDPEPEPEPEPDPTPDPEPDPTPDPGPDPDPDPGFTPDPGPSPEPALPDPVPDPIPDPEDPKEPSHDPEPDPVVTVNPQMKVFSEGYLAGMTYLRRAGDLIAGSGSAAMAEALIPGSDRIGWTPFVIGGGNSLTHKTGSSIRTQGTALLAGLAFGKEGKNGAQAIGGLFLEGGHGNYNTYNSFANAASIHGKGKSDYVGGGVLGRLNLPSRTDSHTYLEGSLRGGRIRINYDSRTLKDALGQVAGYHTRSSYESVHASLGRVMELSDKTTFDLRADYFWTRMSGADVRLTTGDPIKFKAINSQRIRVGGRLSADGGTIKPYVGLAYEHEFAGTSRATTNGHKIAAPSLKGGTVIGEAGVRITPEDSPLTVDLGLQVHGGRRSGVTGDVRFTYRF